MTGPYDKSERVDLSDEAVHWELGSSLSYGEYLQLDKLLVLAVGQRGAQLPVNGFVGKIDPFGFVVWSRHGDCSSPNTHDGTRRQPSRSSRSRLE